MSIVDYISNLEKPTYAPSFNGVYFEDVIPGYRTTDVTGREAYQGDTTELSSEIRDGALFQRNRRQSREITVKFAITTDSNEQYRKSTDKLKGLTLNYGIDPIEKTEFQIIFRDENDKFYRGVITNLTMEKFVDYASGTGEFTIHCADPFKYSLTEYEAYLNNGKFIVDYDGTVRSYPIFEVQATPEDATNPIRWVSFINQDSKIIQVGDVDVAPTDDGEEEKTKSEIIFDNDFSKGAIASQPGVTNRQSSNWATPPSGTSAASYSYALNNGWTNNGLTGIIPLFQGADKFAATGKTASQGGVFQVTDYGSFEKWHGPIVTRTSQFADTNGNSSHKNGTLEFKHKFVTGSNDYGEFMIALTHNQIVNGETKRFILARIGIFKKSKGSNKSTCNLAVYSKTAQGGRLAETFTFDSSSNGNTTKAASVNTAGPATHKITKIDDTIIFEVGGKQVYSFKDTEIKDLTIDGVSFATAMYGTEVRVSVNYLYTMKFTSHSVTDAKDIPNKLNPDGQIVIDTSTAKITMDDIVTYDLGALGNDWETFFLKPGQNEIEFTYSDPFAIGASGQLPVKMRYRKVYL